MPSVSIHKGTKRAHSDGGSSSNTHCADSSTSEDDGVVDVPSCCEKRRTATGEVYASKKARIGFIPMGILVLYHTSAAQAEQSDIGLSLSKKIGKSKCPYQLSFSQKTGMFFLSRRNCLSLKTKVASSTQHPLFSYIS